MAGRIFIAIDVKSLWESCIKLHGPKAKINYKKFKEYLLSLCSDVMVDAIAYSSFNDPGKVAPFHDLLKSLGFVVMEKFITPMYKGNYAADMGVELTTDCVRGAALDSYDTLIIATNDWNFCYPIQEIRKMNRIVLLVGFEDCMSDRLQLIADRVFDIPNTLILNRSEQWTTSL